MSGKNILIAVGVVLVAAAVVGANFYFSRDSGLSVTTEQIKTRDLEAIVSASGKIQPKRLVNITAETAGRVVNLAVNEGDRVHVGEFLLQIDPKSLRTRVDSGEASLQVAQASLEQMRQSVETARVQLDQARQNLTRQQTLWKQQLTTRESLERAENDVRTAESSLQEREKSAHAQDSRIMQERATLDNAKYDLSKVRIESPIEGIVTRRNIQEGETAMIGTMNNAGTVLLTLADMSVIQAEVEVDETNIPNVQLGQSAKITIDAIPDRSFAGHVSEIGNSPIQTTSGGAGTQATNFKVVVILDEKVPEVRPGFTCTADIRTATRKNVTAVPIPSVAVRELIYEANGQIHQRPADVEAAAPQFPRRKQHHHQRERQQLGVVLSVGSGAEAGPDAQGSRGRVRRPGEGKDASSSSRSRWASPATSISKCCRVFKPGDEVLTGPYNSVRNIADGDPVKVDNKRNQRNRTGS